MIPSTALLLRVEKLIGLKPISWKPVLKGYTQAERYVMQFEDGTSAFIKVATEVATIKWLQKEHKAYSIIKADFMPEVKAWEDGEYPILILQDLSEGHWPPPWTEEKIQKVFDTLKKLASIKTEGEFSSLENIRANVSRWADISKDPIGFLSLGVVTKEWLEKSLPILIKAESRAVLEGDSLIHNDIRSDNVCFLEDKTYFVDWNWVVKGNPMFDVLAWLPSLYTEGGPTPWSFNINEPELIAGLAGFHAYHAYQPANFKGAEAIRALQLKLLKVYISWLIKIFDLPKIEKN